MQIFVNESGSIYAPDGSKNRYVRELIAISSISHRHFDEIAMRFRRYRDAVKAISQ